MTGHESAAGETTVSVRLFAAARDRAGRETVSVAMPAGATAGGLRAALAAAVPALAPLAGHLMFAVGTDYVADDAVLTGVAEVVAFPPVSGG